MWFDGLVDPAFDLRAVGDVTDGRPHAGRPSDLQRDAGGGAKTMRLMLCLSCSPDGACVDREPEPIRGDRDVPSADVRHSPAPGPTHP